MKKLCCALCAAALLLAACSQEGDGANSDSQASTVKALVGMKDRASVWTEELEPELLTADLKKMGGVSSRLALTTQNVLAVQAEYEPVFPQIEGLGSLDLSMVLAERVQAARSFARKFAAGESASEFFAKEYSFALYFFRDELDKTYRDPNWKPPVQKEENEANPPDGQTEAPAAAGNSGSDSGKEAASESPAQNSEGSGGADSNSEAAGKPDSEEKSVQDANPSGKEDSEKSGANSEGTENLENSASPSPNPEGTAEANPEAASVQDGNSSGSQEAENSEGTDGNPKNPAEPNSEKAAESEADKGEAATEKAVQAQNPAASAEDDFGLKKFFLPKIRGCKIAAGKNTEGLVIRFLTDGGYFDAAVEFAQDGALIEGIFLRQTSADAAQE